ncbi:MAG: sulfatase-like hydrolase/transferase, partial [Planctomycetota bacterium]|nr:sulfatase-like hydrolase/transferase [Planctomycetota bacterium]
MIQRPIPPTLTWIATLKCIVLASTLLQPHMLAALADPPNIIIIFSDDHGYTDLGIHGIDANVDTPHMDALARGGVLMKAGYASAPQCRPSRCGLLTGRI